MKKLNKNHLRILKKGILKALFLLFCALVYGIIYFWIVLKNSTLFDLEKDFGILNLIFWLGVCCGLIISTYVYLEPRIFKEKKVSLFEAISTFFIIAALFTLFAFFSPLLNWGS